MVIQVRTNRGRDREQKGSIMNDWVSKKMNGRSREWMSNVGKIRKVQWVSEKGMGRTHEGKEGPSSISHDNKTLSKYNVWYSRGHHAAWPHFVLLSFLIIISCSFHSFIQSISSILVTIYHVLDCKRYGNFVGYSGKNKLYNMQSYMYSLCWFKRYQGGRNLSYFCSFIFLACLS